MARFFCLFFKKVLTFLMLYIIIYLVLISYQELIGCYDKVVNLKALTAFIGSHLRFMGFCEYCALFFPNYNAIKNRKMLSSIISWYDIIFKLVL